MELVMSAGNLVQDRVGFLWASPHELSNSWLPLVSASLAYVISWLGRSPSSVVCGCQSTARSATLGHMKTRMLAKQKRWPSLSLFSPHLHSPSEMWPEGRGLENTNRLNWTVWISPGEGKAHRDRINSSWKATKNILGFCSSRGKDVNLGSTIQGGNNQHWLKMKKVIFMNSGYQIS